MYDFIFVVHVVFLEMPLQVVRHLQNGSTYHQWAQGPQKALLG